MGIRRLMSDLLVYGTDTVLGRQPKPSIGTECVQTVIIDGPSLVYFVYNRLLLHRALEAGSGHPRLPTYDEVGRAYSHLLADLVSHGADM
jgi:hypothetical protein